MEFMSRNNNQGAAAAGGHGKKSKWAAKLVRIEVFIVIVGAALLLASLSIFLAISGNINNEDKLVNSDKFQAVFLNGGSTSGSVTYSTYFGHITSLNDRYMVLQNVYYLTTASNNSSNPQLIKLGCQQLHAPYDEMVINHDQIAFWENLQSSGKVVQAIDQFQKQNPNGPNCSQTSSSSSQSATTPSSSTSSPTTTNTGTSGQ
jgi:hypothetical protein